MNTEDSAEKPGRGAIDRQLRGSSLLLAGRLLSKLVNFGVQVAIIRLLTKDDFGAFAYGLALVAAGEVLVKLGLGHGANRFVPYYFERKEYPLLLGTLGLVVVTILVLGAMTFGILWWVSDQGFSGFPRGSGGTVVLLLALLAPIQALDQICVQTLACLAKPKAILVRKHVVGPGLRALAVAIAFVADGSSEVLAGAYLAGGLLGLMICLQIVLKELRAHGVLPLPVSQWRIPWSPLANYSFPLISSDVVSITLTGITTVLLMTTSGELEVASMRAVAPAAALNMLVVQSFGILFLPSAARLFARNDLSAFSQQHWESVAWVSVLSFPIFALTFCIAPKLVVVLFGQEYASSAAVLAVLAIGNFAAVAMAFNAESLQVLHRTRALAWSNLLMIVSSVVLAALLCPAYGAMGAAIAVTVARLLGVGTRQIALLRSNAMSATPTAIRSIWLQLLGASLGVGLVGWVWQPALMIQLLVMALGCLWLLRACARKLDVARTFPELLRVPLISRLLVA